MSNGMGVAVGDSNAVAHQPHVVTPQEVLSWLPADATPAQQDSAIQSHVKVSEIHWSEQPDTLHMPGHPKGKSYRDVSLPQYYRESYFSTSKYFHPEIAGGRMGVAGDPVPYTIGGDNLVTAFLLGCFVLTAIAIANLRDFIVRQVKYFFRVAQGVTTEFTETKEELWAQYYLVFQTSFFLALIYFLYTRSYVSDTFVVEQYLVIVFYGLTFLSYFLLKACLYWGVGWVFFDVKKNEQWTKSFLFLSSLEGVLLFPLVLLLSFFDISVETAIIYVLIAGFLVKILSFFRLYIIFFRKKDFLLQFFLYLCTLEMQPLLVLWGVLVLMSHYLKVNF